MTKIGDPLRRRQRHRGLTPPGTAGVIVGAQVSAPLFEEEKTNYGNCILQKSLAQLNADFGRQRLLATEKDQKKAVPKTTKDEVPGDPSSGDLFFLKKFKSFFGGNNLAPFPQASR